MPTPLRSSNRSNDDASLLFEDSVHHKNKNELRSRHGMKVVRFNKECNEDVPILLGSNAHSENADAHRDVPSDTSAAPPKMNTIKAFHHIYPKGSKFQRYLSLKGCAGISPGWCQGTVVGHYDSCVLIQFRVDNASVEKLCDELEEWPLNTFWDGVLHEKRGRIYHIRQYPIKEVLLAFDLWNAADEPCAAAPVFSTIWRVDSGGRCSPRPDPRLSLGRRVAKCFDGQLFLGTVIGCSKDDLWKIYYDDGDEEEYNLAELIRYLKLYTRSIVVDSETATCDRIRFSGRNDDPTEERDILPNPDRHSLKKILNTFVDVELSMYTAELSVEARVELVTDSDAGKFVATDVIVNECEPTSENPIPESEDTENKVVNDVEANTVHQENSVDTDCYNTSEILLVKEEESSDYPQQGLGLDDPLAPRAENEFINETVCPRMLGHPLPGESEHALCKSQSQWADFPIGCSVLFKGMLKATVECVYFNFRDKVYRYGIQLSRGGSRLQVKGTDLSLAIDSLDHIGRESNDVVGCPSAVDDRRRLEQTPCLLHESDGNAILGAGRIKNSLNMHLACSDTVQKVITAEQSASINTRVGISGSGVPTMVSPLEVTNRIKRKAIQDSTAIILSIPKLESKKRKVDLEYMPYVRKECRGFAVETPALRPRNGDQKCRHIKFGRKPWLKCGIHSQSRRITERSQGPFHLGFS